MDCPRGTAKTPWVSLRGSFLSPLFRDLPGTLSPRCLGHDARLRPLRLADEAYPSSVVRVVLDNLNTHRRASLYETFPAEEARRIAKRGGQHAQARELVEHGGALRLTRHEPNFTAFTLVRPCLGETALGRVRQVWGRGR